MGQKDYDEQPIQYDPDFRGPTANRSCTDVFFLVLFIVFLVGWAGVGIYAISYGDITKIIQPQDSLGRKCGIDNEVRDKPYMLFFDLMECAEHSPDGQCYTEQVCVAKCPTEDFNFEKLATKNSDVDFLQESMICKPEINKSDEIVDFRTARNLMANRKCASRQIKSKPSASNICVPIDVDKMSLEIEGVTPASVRSAFRSAKRAASIDELSARMIQDFVDSWWKILLVLIGSMVVCLLYIVAMRWIAGPMVWISIIGVILLLTIGTAAAFTLYSKLPDGNDAILALVVGIILAVILILLLVLFICGYQQIGVSIALIKVGARAVGSAKSTMLFPLIPWVMQAVVIAFSVVVAIELASFGGAPKLTPFTVKNLDQWNCSVIAAEQQQFTNSLPCDPELFKHCSRIVDGNVEVFSADKFDPFTDCVRRAGEEEENKSDTTGYFHAYNVFGFFWTMVFISALGDMVLAITFATWYWTLDKNDVPYFALTLSIFKVYRYHVGTLAFGSLILAICKIIRAMLKKNSNTGNGACNCILCVCRCIFWCVERIIKFITKNAYIMCAIHGTNFCTSAKNAFSLIMRNAGVFIVADQITGLLLFMSKLIVTLIMGGIAYLVFAYDWDAMNDDILNHGLAPVILVIIVTFFIACIFFGVYDMAIDTIVLCFLEDCERNDGSPQRPYFMTRELLEIMDKSNKS